LPNIPTFDNVSDLNNANGFTITIGKIQSNGNVITTGGGLTTPENYFFITSTSKCYKRKILKVVVLVVQRDQ
jgi:hypothetical protein